MTLKQKVVQVCSARRFLCLPLLCLLGALPIEAQAYAGAELGNHDHSFTVGEAEVLFDEVEYGEAFDPEHVDNGKPWQQINKHLNVMAGTLPRTAEYLRSIFSTGRLLWYFVSVENITIKKVDKGDVVSPVVISYEQNQISLNRNGIVYIRKDLWDRLSERGRALLLVHEMYWTALGDSFIGTGYNVRALSAMLLNETLAKMSLYNAGSLMLNLIREDNHDSKLAQLVKHEMHFPQGQGGFYINEYYAGRGENIVARVKAEHPLKNMLITALNPNLEYRHTFFSDSTGELKVSMTSPEQKPVLFPLASVNTPCESLEYAGSKNWRIPTLDEVYDLFRLGLLRLQYGPLKKSTYLNDLNRGFSGTPDKQFLIPSGVRLITYDREVVTLSSRFEENTFRYEDFVLYLCVSDPKN